MQNYAQRLKINSRNLRKKSTPHEIKLWSKIKNRSFHNLKFRRQHVIDKYIVDFICLEKKIIIELDGSQHKREKDQKYDRKRNDYLKNLGFIVLRFWNNEVNDNLNGIMLKIEEFIN
ncbi:MAG: DNA (cytosine-5-)-methyltransferase [Candidatus Moranbacteria bacterium CG10_big_fil_rev_8_21_14_0_10_35_21]|nr:MAG: DNA (cytosine-5-)-methyltransferase [Candidatus Moranbacteria bacterium CG10_big_fil_rev_8_21_14_0_10_35_21]PJA88995.1 MAG: DNA (cytosine-5-)-methyltransferase [Candidatus Moranbacteria bacterium CG_4_9_14_3_um_filter_36_9]